MTFTKSIKKFIGATVILAFSSSASAINFSDPTGTAIYSTQTGVVTGLSIGGNLMLVQMSRLFCIGHLELVEETPVGSSTSSSAVKPGVRITYNAFITLRKSMNKGIPITVECIGDDSGNWIIAYE